MFNPRAVHVRTEKAVALYRKFNSPFDIINMVCQPSLKIKGRVKLMKKSKNNDIGRYLRMLCEYK